MTILLLTDDKSKLKVAGTSMKSNMIRMGEKITGLKYKDFKIDLNKSDIYRSVVKEGKTVFFNFDEIMNESFPKPIALLLSKIGIYGNKSGIITPLRRGGKIIGMVSLGSPELGEEFIPSVKNLAQHISTALDLAEEYTERNNAEATSRKRFKELNCLYSISNLLHTGCAIKETLQGTVNLIIPSWQYPVNTCARITLGDQEFKTGNFRETTWKQASNIKVYCKKRGTVEVYYLEEKPEADEGPFLSEERDLINLIADELGRIIERAEAQEDLKEVNRKMRSANKKLNASEQQLTASNEQLVAGEMQLLTANHDRNERFKELGCLYGISKLIKRKNATIKGVLGGAVKLIRSSWQYPEITCARIVVDDQEFRTENYEETIWRQAGDIKVDNKQIGTVEVYYLEEKPKSDEGPFQKEERGLINAVAEEVGRFVKRKQAKEALQNSEQRFRTLTESTSDWIWEVDENAAYTYVSPRVRDLLGFEPEEAIGKTPFDLMPPDEAKRMGKIFADIAKARKPFEGLENVNLHKNGHKVVLETSGVPVFDANGNFRGYRGIDRDITERKRAEEEVKHARDDYMATTNLTGDIIVKVDTEGKWAFINNAACKFWGKPKKELIGSAFADYLHPDDYVETMDVAEKIKRGKTINNFVNRQETPEGWRVVEWNIAPIFNNAGNHIGLQATGRDITERRKAEKALMESELKYRAIFEGSADGILVADVNSKKFKFANKSLCEMLGYTEQEMKKLGILDIHPKESLDYIIDEFMAQARGEKTLSENIPCLRKDGTIVYADFNTRPMTFNGNGCNIGFVRDVTERKKSEEERIILEEQLRQSEKLRAIGELAGGVAHDFNNMLGAITGYADLIAEENMDEHGRDKDAVLGKRITTITRASYRAADLIKKLLAFSRRGKYRNAPVDMHEIINDVLALLEGSIDKKITLKTKLTAENPVTKGDPSQIQNAILNMAINACDAMKEGGVLLISTRNESLAKDQCCVETEAGIYLMVAVSDTGTGMDEDTKSRIFEPFFSTKETGEGTGLGLPSVYGTVKSHKGCVTVESRIGVGSRFKLYFPVSDLKDTTIKTEDNGIMEMGQGTILLVDDEEMVRSMVSESLIRCGYTVYTCNNGSEAVEWYKEYHANTDLVILDMVMPVMDGMECYQNLRKMNPKVKVILASGFSINDKVHKLIENGALEFIEKPFSRIDLSRLVAKLLRAEENREIERKEREHVTS